MIHAQSLLPALLDPASAAIVVGGTLLATVLRSGLADARATLAALAALPRRRFDAERARAELAHQINQIREDGVLRAAPTHVGDAEIDAATDALIGNRSLHALRAAHESHRRRQGANSLAAARTLAQAAELSPVFGLAGTLVSLAALSQSAMSGNFSGAISSAVLTTLYGLLLGNLVFAPLARAVERAAARDAAERSRLAAWLEEQVAPAMPRLNLAVATGRGA